MAISIYFKLFSGGFAPLSRLADLLSEARGRISLPVTSPVESDAASSGVYRSSV